MSQVHPGEIELVGSGEGDGSGDVAEHLRWCARCRSVVADHRWLEGEIGATLAAAADAVPVPQPRWWVVQGRLAAGQRRVAGWRVSAVAGAVLAFCLMLSLSPVLGTAVAARTLPPEAMVAPAPATAVGTSEHVASLATPTPAISRGESTPSPTPAFMLPPTPPEPEV